MTKPVRIQLSRRKGFKLQAVSKAINGLEAVKVDRSTKWGNPAISDDAALAVGLFRTWIKSKRVDVARDLRGKNLACWCKPGTPCHADVLLKLANS